MKTSVGKGFHTLAAIVAALIGLYWQMQQQQDAFAAVSSSKDIPLQGYVDERYETVKDTLLQAFLSGKQVGAGVAAYVDGKLVVDLQAGWQDYEARIPYTENTLQVVYSCTKVLVFSRGSLL